MRAPVRIVENIQGNITGPENGCNHLLKGICLVMRCYVFGVKCKARTADIGYVSYFGERFWSTSIADHQLGS